MRTPRSFLALSLAVLSVVAACDMGGDDNANGGLVNTSWTVMSIDGDATLADARPTLLFAPEGLSGTHRLQLVQRHLPDGRRPHHHLDGGHDRDGL